MEDVELTLTPSGPLIDGSEGKTLVLRQGDHYWVQFGYLEDIPIGRYTVTAILKNEAGPRPLRIQDWHTEDAFKPELQIHFIPASNGRTGASASIVVGYCTSHEPIRSIPLMKLHTTARTATISTTWLPLASRPVDPTTASPRVHHAPPAP